MTSARTVMMREHQIFHCPFWCIQPDDEEQNEQHFSKQIPFTTADGQVILFRVQMTWWTDAGEDLLILQPQLDGDGEITFSGADWVGITDLGQNMFGLNDDPNLIEAYDGAARDEYIATYGEPPDDEAIVDGDGEQYAIGQG